MGITGLLPFVKNSCRPANIKDFSGASVAIDAYSWLHKGAFACAEKLVKGEKTDGYVFYCIKLLNMLIDAGVKPIMVFDGCNLSSKAITEKKRRENREKTRQRGKELLCEGKVKEARECFQRCVDVTPEMAREVIQACRKKAIDCIVAPYEADAQLAYLDKSGMAQLIITEDSDLILFGCNKILFKMDSCGGGMLFEKENLPKSFGSNASRFSFEKFRYMCILSGCDYLPSLPGIGLAKACKFFSLTTNTDLSVVLSKLPSYLKMPKLVVTNEYKESFLKANNTFLYQLAFCPKEKRLVPLTPYPEGVTPEELEYAGKYMEDDLAHQLAMGNINVKTLKEFDSTLFSDSPAYNEDRSVIWSSNSSFKENKSSKKETAFKFNTPKKKLEASQKRKYVELEDEKEIAEDLFSLYAGADAKKTKLEDLTEEEPIILNSDSCNELPSAASQSSLLKSSPETVSSSQTKIIRSRFFSSEYHQSSHESRSDDFLSSSVTSDCTTIDDEVENNVFQRDLSKYNKENVLNRFAKKKTQEFTHIECTNVNKVSPSFATPKQESLSVLDVFSNESSATTNTISSMQKSAKILTQTPESDCKKLRPKSLFAKKNSAPKLISTKIHDFKWKKEPLCRTSNISLGSDGNSGDESFEDSPVVNTPLKSPLKEISPYFLNCDNESVANISSMEESETVITIISDSEEIEESKNSCNRNRSPKGLKLHMNTSGLTDDKLSKCRTIGLSKKRKSSGTIARKETLLNFNFTRKSVSVESS